MKTETEVDSLVSFVRLFQAFMVEGKKRFMEEVGVQSEVLDMVGVSKWIIVSFTNTSRNKVKEISWDQSMQTFVECYQFVFIPANLKWIPTKFLKKFVYTIKFCSTRDN